ncbi:MAG TPA: hypothetical protein VH722_13175, partial [Alphaproteobacteria bacterium]|nr:hypothetical protein [Alphaproteobacteria bacterium]
CVTDRDPDLHLAAGGEIPRPAAIDPGLSLYRPGGLRRGADRLSQCGSGRDHARVAGPARSCPW